MNDHACSPHVLEPPVVLVVEDDGPLLELAAQIFERAGYRTLCAASAEQALSISADEPLALVFSDVVLPGRSGLDLADELLAARPDLPVLITTGQWDESVRRAVDRAGHQVLRKPYTATQVVEAALRARSSIEGATSRDSETPG